MQKKKSNTLKLTLAAAASLALTLGGVAPAFAANVQIGPGDVQAFENGDESSETWNYDQWHIGSTENPDAKLEQSIAFQECSVTMLASPFPDEADWVQVMKGFPVDGRPTFEAGGTADVVKALVDSTSITVLTGSVTLQIPVFALRGGVVNDFTTIRSELLEPGTYNLADLAISASNNGFPWVTFADFFAFLESSAVSAGDGIEILGVGFNGSADAVVKSLSFGGDTYFFGTGKCLPTAATPPTKIETAA